VEQTNANIRDWRGIASSRDGMKLAAGVYGGYIYTSSDSGVTWVEQTNAGSRYWNGIALSSDGYELVAAAQNDYIYTSSLPIPPTARPTSLPSLVPTAWPTSMPTLVVNLDGSGLCDIYNQQSGTVKETLTTWCVGSGPHDPCGASAWRGVTCSGGRVSQVIINWRNIQGTLPTTLGNLEALEYLSLTRNCLTGSLPTELGRLTGMVSLEISYNSLVGSLPSDLGLLTKFQFLQLSGNCLSGSLPTELGRLTDTV
jgi:hypothetical protein